jgi:hypothetical protein
MIKKSLDRDSNQPSTELFTSIARSFYCTYFKVALISHGTHLNINEANKPNYYFHHDFHYCSRYDLIIKIVCSR